MNEEVNKKISAYESRLRDAERAIESAMREVCSVSGPFHNGDLYNALEIVQNNIRNTYRFYNNEEFKIV